MYSVTIKNPNDEYETLIYSDISATEDTKLEKVELKLAVNSAGSLSITLPYMNAGYSLVNHLTTEAKVWRNDTGGVMKEIWRGRALTEDSDFWNNRVLLFEGELAYLNDTIQPQLVYDQEVTIELFIEAVLTIHNDRCIDDSHKFYVGNVTVEKTDSAYFSTDFQNTLDSLMVLVDRYGGMFVIRHENGVRYLDYLEDYPTVAEQTIEFGSNLMDITKYWDLSEFATVIIPLGADQGSVAIENKVIYDPGDGYVYKDPETDYRATLSEIEDVYLDVPTLVVGDKNYRRPLGFKIGDDNRGSLTYIKPNETTPTKADIATLVVMEDYYPQFSEYLNISSVNNGSMYLINTAGVHAYGRIEKVINFDDINDATELKTAGQEYLTSIQYDGMTLELEAIDLRYFNVDVASINLLDKVRVISAPHEIDLEIPVTELNIPLNRPEDSKISLGGNLTGTKAELSSISWGTIKTVRNKMAIVGQFGSKTMPMPTPL